MKKTLYLLIFCPLLSYGQYDFFAAEYFFGRLPSARAEAMGKASVSIDGDLSTIAMNPAGLATINGLAVSSTLASPYYEVVVGDGLPQNQGSHYRFFQMGYRLSKQLALGLQYNNFAFESQIQNIPDPVTSTYALTVAYQPIENFMLGANVNYMDHSSVSANRDQTMYFDFGVIKTFKLASIGVFSHRINAAGSISNFSFAKIDLNEEKELPVTSRIGLNYQVEWDRKLWIPSLKTISMLVQTEYQWVLNADYHRALRFGSEVTLLEMLSLRAGYFTEPWHVDGLFDGEDYMNDFTYGFGLKAPLSKLTNVPLNVFLDYTSLPQPPRFNSDQSWENFSSFNLTMQWVLER